MISATLILLGFWLAVVCYFDIDDFRQRRRRSASPTPIHPKDRDTAGGA